MKYDYFIGGDSRNGEAVEHVLEAVRLAGKTAYCFLENAYNGDENNPSPDLDANAAMHTLESFEGWRTNPTFLHFFEKDMNAIRNSTEAIFVFPSELAAHLELGAAYGMGKKCYGIGPIDEYETLYLMMESLYPDIETFLKQEVGVEL